MAKIYKTLPENSESADSMLITASMILSTPTISKISTWESAYGQLAYKGVIGCSGVVVKPDGPMLAITKNSKNKEAAWSFVKTMFSEEFQKNYFLSMLPTNEFVWKWEYSRRTGIALETELPYIQERYNLINSLLDSNPNLYEIDNSLYDIIYEECLAFFNSDKSAAETAAIIQSRAQIYLDEQW